MVNEPKAAFELQYPVRGDSQMRKSFATLCMVMILAWSFDLAFAGGNHWFSLQRKAKRAVEGQERQDKRFKALEKESVDLLKKIEGARKLIHPSR
jgi:hypothetical protein